MRDPYHSQVGVFGFRGLVTSTQGNSVIMLGGIFKVSCCYWAYVYHNQI